MVKDYYRKALVQLHETSYNGIVSFLVRNKECS